MRPEALEYVRYRLDRANEAVEEAELLFGRGHLSTTVNRLYYACFYAVSALLLSEGQSSIKHSGVRALFDRHWIKTGRLPVEMGRFYRFLFDQRHKGDYDDLATFDPAAVETWLAEAKKFVDEISAFIKEDAS